MVTEQEQIEEQAFEELARMFATQTDIEKAVQAAKNEF